jgi:hypothetical protein
MNKKLIYCTTFKLNPYLTLHTEVLKLWKKKNLLVQIIIKKSTIKHHVKVKINIKI